MKFSSRIIFCLLVLSPICIKFVESDIDDEDDDDEPFVSHELDDMDQGSDVLFRYINSDEDHSPITEFLRKNFFMDEPLNIAADLFENNSTDENPDLEGLIAYVINANFSLKAVSKDNEILGVQLVAPFNPIGETDDQDCKTNFRKVVKFLYYAESHAGLENLSGNDTAEIILTSVHRDYRKHGIATKMTEVTLGRSSEMGYKNIYTGVTNKYMIQLNQKLNLEMVYEIKYEDYLDDDKNVVFKPPPPHTSFASFVGHLNETYNILPLA